MFDAMKKLNAERNVSLSLRIGLNTGPVVAGIIGTSKFIYDLWGDAVNVASRMQSNGIPNKVQVTADMREKLRHKYDFEKREQVPIKGKGAVDTYLLTP